MKDWTRMAIIVLIGVIYLMVMVFGDICTIIICLWIIVSFIVYTALET